MPLTELREVSRGIPYKRHVEIGSAMAYRYTQFSYYFPERRTVIVRVLPTRAAERVAKYVADAGTVYYFSSSTSPRKLEMEWSDGKSSWKESHDLPASAFMLDETPDKVGGDELLWDE